MQVYKGLTADELEAQYFLRGTRPGYVTSDMPRWLERSKQFVDSANGKLDLVYGPRERNRLDLFPAQIPAGDAPAGFILHIHGGYWQRGDKSIYSYIAEPFVKRGFAVALMNYQMCPDVRLGEITEQSRLAVSWLWRNAEDLGIDRGNFNVMGHSAGGHQAVEMLFTDWSKEADDLPRDLISSAVAVSGIYDFEPILYCSENAGLRLDKDEARAVSPIYRHPASDAPLLLAHGLNEPPDMHRQSTDFHARFKDTSRRMDCIGVPGADHFETVDVLADDKSELFARALEFILARSRAND
ncbi:MAG: alpha/beta hydrolase [Rhizobiales bacterium]|nr:alpha/beta hydrolase [Hyphomicrobiales bacterium]